MRSHAKPAHNGAPAGRDRGQTPGRDGTSRGPSNQGLQAKLRVGPGDDPAEREADRAADAVLAGLHAPPGPPPPPALRRKCARCTEEDDTTLRRRAEDEGEIRAESESEAAGPVAGGAEAAAEAVSAGGAPLSSAMRAYFEPRFGADFSDVRIHTGG